MDHKRVIESDFRKPEFRHADPEDYEFRKDGAIVRKDRWERGIRKIAARITDDAREFEISNLVDVVEWLLDKIPDMGGSVLDETPMRLIQDNDGHWYVIPSMVAHAFETWVTAMETGNFNGADDEPMDFPPFDDMRVDGPHGVTFNSYKEVRQQAQ